MTRLVHRGSATDDVQSARVEQFAPRLFASLCHLTVGDRPRAERLLLETCRELARTPHTSIDLDAAVVAAHRLYITDANRIMALVGEVRRSGPDTAPAVWSVHALGELSPAERVALSLAEVEHQTVPAIAHALDVDIDAADAVLVAARTAANPMVLGESVSDAFRRAEAWMDDPLRERVHNLVTGEGALSEAERRAQRDQRTRRATQGAAVAAVVLLAVAVRWIITAPSNANTAAIGSATVTLATDLTDLQTVRPDAVVRFSDGRIGVSWVGACNRPATTITVVPARSGAGIRLVTGAYPVVSCVGMPTHWTAVIDPQLRNLPKGPILPLQDGSDVQTTYTKYSEAAAPAGTARKGSVPGDTSFASTLLDSASQPWTFETDCRRLQTTAYESAAGPMFESRLTSTGHACQSLDNVPRLVGPAGQSFPHTDGGTPAGTEDCKGPAGSATDLAFTQPATTIIGDGRLSTWDGCRVRSGVMYTTPLPTVCGWQSARIITFSTKLGQSITSAHDAVTYIRDPKGVVPGDREAFTVFPSIPVDGYDTGIRLDSQPLWLSAHSPDLYVITPTGVERWPVFTGTLGCTRASS
ncbi:MAG TPA: hypothetical protein VGM78_11470 [Ilumatobacteraceae bacterium]